VIAAHPHIKTAIAFPIPTLKTAIALSFPHLKPRSLLIITFKTAIAS
jgi:hypothetical protein